MQEVTVTLTSDEALVMFELIHRWEDSDRIDPVLMPGGQTALWGLSGRLESMQPCRVAMEPLRSIDSTSSAASASGARPSSRAASINQAHW
ncbi:MAG: hypothetical protein ABSF03_15010 [Streptosporangiaceae bacterium]